MELEEIGEHDFEYLEFPGEGGWVEEEEERQVVLPPPPKPKPSRNRKICRNYVFYSRDFDCQDSYLNSADYDEDEEETEEEEGEGKEEDLVKEREELEKEDKIIKSTGKTQDDIESELYELQTQLINRYILAKAELKFEKKRNAFFQDRIYRASVRKGFIIESELVDEATVVKKKKHHRHCRVTAIEAKEEEGEGRDFEEEEGEQESETVEEHLREAKAILENDENLEEEEYNDEEEEYDDEEEEEEEGEGEGEENDEDAGTTKKRKKRRHRRQKKGSSEQLGKRGGQHSEKLANETKYKKLLRKITKLQQVKGQYLVQHEINLQNISDKCEEWSELHKDCLNNLLNLIRYQSKVAIDSNTGKRMSFISTENYCGAVSRIHKKLCETLLKMYKSHRGLEFTLKRLREAEVQEGEEIEILEYEQLRDENGTLKDKLGDKIKDVENIKGKISHAIQILAHIRNKTFNMNQGISDGGQHLNNINQEVYAARAKTEEAMKRYLELRHEERGLVVDSGLLDNPTLLRDYEETSERVLGMREEKKRLDRLLFEGARELKDMQDQTTELRVHYPAIFENSNLDGETGKESRVINNCLGLKYLCQTNSSENTRPRRQ